MEGVSTELGIEARATDPQPERYGLGLCLSGGGYRAMLFHAGSLARLNDEGLLARTDMISSVSGGSVASGLLAYIWPKLRFEGDVAVNFREEYLARIVAFSQVLADVPSIMKGLLNPFSSAASEAAKVFETKLLENSRLSLKSLPRRPWFVFCASNLSTGSLFRMSNRYIADYRVGYAPGADLPLATAIAASAAFPPVLSPMRIDLSRFDWKEGKVDPSIGSTVPPGLAVLTDGGVYDNHGIEPTLKRCDRVLVSDAGAPWQHSDASFWNYFSQLKRVLDTTDNQVRSLRRRTLVELFNAAKEADQIGLTPAQRASLGVRTRGVYWSISENEENLVPHASFRLEASSIVPASIGTYLHFLGAAETERLINWGYYVCDARMRQFYPDPISSVPGPPIPNGGVKASLGASMSRTLFNLLPWRMRRNDQ